MPRVTIFVITEREQDWQLANAWLDRWRNRMAVCPDEPEGCLCCVAWWDVDAPQEALDELPPRLLQTSDWSKGVNHPAPNPGDPQEGN
jgi:hypothetical protein